MKAQKQLTKTQQKQTKSMQVSFPYWLIYEINKPIHNPQFLQML